MTVALDEDRSARRPTPRGFSCELVNGLWADSLKEVDVFVGVEGCHFKGS